MEDLMLRIDNVSKQYRLGQIGGTTLRDELQRWSAKRRGKEDPTKKIGVKDFVSGETFMALDGVSFDVRRGERVGIIGHNGAGKSTLLKLISRVTAPTGGTIGLNGRVASMLEVGTGFHPELTGRENIYMNGAILGMNRHEIDAKMEDIIEFSECRQFIDTPVKRYSSGMYVKLAFSVTAHLDSEIMIMDEVLAVGDINFQQKCIEKMRSLAANSARTILCVSHNMETIRRLCNRCVVLDHGVLDYDGEVEKGIQSYNTHNEDLQVKTRNLASIARGFEVSGTCALECVTLTRTVLGTSEALEFELQIVTLVDIENVLLRLVVCDAVGNAVGTSYTEGFPISRGSWVGSMVLDASFFAPGMYFVDLILCEYDGRKQIRHDIVNQAFSFRVEETNVLHNAPWITNAWGCIRLPETKVRLLCNGVH